MPNFSPVNVLAYKVLPKFIYIYIVKIHQNYINNPMRLFEIHVVVIRWIWNFNQKVS